jgi:hypothetical protein
LIILSFLLEYRIYFDGQTSYFYTFHLEMLLFLLPNVFIVVNVTSDL